MRKTICCVLLGLGFQFVVMGASSALAAPPTERHNPSFTWGMKLVNETVTDEDLGEISALGINITSGEWGMDEAEPAVVLALLDRVQARGLKMIINLSEGAAWGYRDDGSDDPLQNPVWQSKRIRAYVMALKHHPAIYGYDISNEAGENLPNGNRVRITSQQIREAAAEVRSVDNMRPIIMRMHYWDEEDGDFTDKNPIAPGAADIVILNLYSNYTNNGESPLLPTMVADAGQKLADKIQTASPGTEVWIALGTFREEPQFLAPTVEDLRRDIAAALTISGISNISFFGWGPERYPTQGTGWYLPGDGKLLLPVIKEYISQP